MLRFLVLECGADVNFPTTPNRCVALHVAVDQCHCAAVKFLLARGANVHASNDDGCNALHLAAQSGSATIAQVLLAAARRRRERLLNAATASGHTPLMLAAAHGHAHAIDVLVAAGAAVDGKSDKQATALLFAAYNGHYECCRRLLLCGAQVDARDYRGRTPLTFAIINGHARVVQLLLLHGAAPSSAQRADDNFCCDIYPAASTAAATRSAASRDLLISVLCCLRGSVAATTLNALVRDNEIECLPLVLAAKCDFQGSCTKKCCHGGAVLGTAVRAANATAAALILAAQAAAPSVVGDDNCASVDGRITLLAERLVSANCVSDARDRIAAARHQLDIARALWNVASRVPQRFLLAASCAQCRCAAYAHCSACRVAFYCSQKCQRHHWPVHILECTYGK